MIDRKILIEPNLDILALAEADHVSGNLEKASLLENGSEVNALTENGHFPLYCAAGHGHAEATECLLENRADRDQRMSDGRIVSEWLAMYADNNPRLKTCLALIEGK